MQMFRSKKTEVPKYLNPEGEYKDWKDAWPEIESLGHRLDAAREARDRCEEGTWSHTLWSQTADTLFRKWSLTVTLYQTGLRQRGPERGFDIDYSWWEGSDEPVGQLPVPAWLNLNFINDWFNHNDLEHSWAKAQEQKLQKARQGLA